jgi:hypothetical protein
LTHSRSLVRTCFYFLILLLNDLPIRQPQKDMALPYLLILQVRHIYSVPRRPALSLLPVRGACLQDFAWRRASLSRLKGQGFNCKSASSRCPLLWRRCCQDSNKCEGCRGAKRVHLCRFFLSRTTTGSSPPSLSQQHGNKVCLSLFLYILLYS